MVRNCPKCKLTNPESAQICDCGYNFITGVHGEPIEGSRKTRGDAPTPSMYINSVNETYTKKMPESETKVAEKKLNNNNRKGGIKFFFKTPLTYVFMIFGPAIGKKLGLSLASTPAQASAYVGMSVFICVIFAAFTGYFISIGIDASLNQKIGRVLLKLFAGIICFFIYALILAAIP